MTSPADIANLALQELGLAPVITAVFPPDSTSQARAMNHAYKQALKSSLQDHDWKFAGHYVSLTADPTAPISADWATRYTLPSDHVQPRKVETTAEWEWVGEYIYTNHTGALLFKYTRLIEDENLFSAHFIDYFALKLALRTVSQLTQSGTKQDRLRRRLIDDVEGFSFFQDSQGGTAVEFEEDSWLTARR